MDSNSLFGSNEGGDFNGGKERWGGEGFFLNYIYVWFQRGEKRRDILIKNIFGARGDERNYR